MTTFEKPDLTFPWTEYIFFGLTLIASLGIGIYYGFFGKKNATNEEYLMAGRSMPIMPVAMSLICSFVSAISLLGGPVETYLYGAQYVMMALANVPVTLCLMYLYVPVYFRLQLTSAYEYFELRFSRRLRLTITVIAIFHMMFYMPTTVYAPSLALDQVAGIDVYLSCSAIFIICIAYSSIGGLKAVIWTDALQAFVMYAALIAVIAAGVVEVGGFSSMWEKAAATERVNFFIFDIDPRARHTFFSNTIGATFLSLALFGATQGQIQRYTSVPTLKHSRITLFFNMIGLATLSILGVWIGLILYGNYYECDPIKAKIVDTTDQLLPLFVIEVLSKFPGVPGLFVAGLTCGSLSSVSSSMNSLAAIITEDFVRPRARGLSEERLALLSKIISALTGVIAFGLVFVTGELNKSTPILSLSSLVHGMLLVPILGAFTLGIFFPWTEEIGTFAGIATAIPTAIFVGFGGVFAGRKGVLPSQRLTQRTDGCEIVDETTRFLLSISPVPEEMYVGRDDWKEDAADDSALIQIFSVSYMWQPLIAFVVTMVVGLVVSAIVVRLREGPPPKVNARLLSTPFLTMGKKLFGQSYLNKWVDYNDDSPRPSSSIEDDFSEKMPESIAYNVHKVRESRSSRLSSGIWNEIKL